MAAVEIAGTPAEEHDVRTPVAGDFRGERNVANPQGERGVEAVADDPDGRGGPGGCGEKARRKRERERDGKEPRASQRGSVKVNPSMHPESYSSPTPPRGEISIIIPVWQDHAALAVLLPKLRGFSEVREVIVSFAQADPAALRMASGLGAKCVGPGSPNRGRQLDAGAEIAVGEWLLFHHADSLLTAEHVRSIAALQRNPAIVGGAFYRQFDERHPALRWLEPVERWHNRAFGALFGDQSLFARREVFRELGGFRGLPLMEDVDFSLRLRRRGKIALLDPPIASSPRKHLAQGPWRTTFTNVLLLALYHLGVSPQRLHAHYYRRGAATFPEPPGAVETPAHPRQGTCDEPGSLIDGAAID